MGEVVALDDVRVRASDVSGQRSEPVRAPREATVGEWVEQAIGQLGLKRKDTDGNPYTYDPRLDREARILNPSEIVGEVLREDDQVVLQPNITAG